MDFPLNSQWLRFLMVDRKFKGQLGDLVAFAHSDKEQHPDLYCMDDICLWPTKLGECESHKGMII